jgi:hypothetical protein
MEQAADLRRIRDPGPPDHRLVNSVGDLSLVHLVKSACSLLHHNQVFDVLVSEFLLMGILPADRPISCRPAESQLDSARASGQTTTKRLPCKLLRKRRKEGTEKFLCANCGKMNWRLPTRSRGWPSARSRGWPILLRSWGCGQCAHPLEGRSIIRVRCRNR